MTRGVLWLLSYPQAVRTEIGSAFFILSAAAISLGYRRLLFFFSKTLTFRDRRHVFQPWTHCQLLHFLLFSQKQRKERNKTISSAAFKGLFLVGVIFKSM